MGARATCRLAPIWLAVLVGCGSTSQSPSAPSVEAVRWSVSVPETCPMLVECFAGFVEYRSCDRFKLEFRLHTTEFTHASHQLLAELVSEVRGLGDRVGELVIEGHIGSSESESLAGQRAAQVRRRLAERGLPVSILQLAGSGGEAGSEVRLYARGCDGAVGGRSKRVPKSWWSTF